MGEEERSPWVVLGTPDFTKEVRQDKQIGLTQAPSRGDDFPT